MPLTQPNDDRPPRIGDYYVHRSTGDLVEIMDVEPSGDCMVLNVKAPLDDDWQHVTASQIFSSFWERLADTSQAA